MTYPGPAPTSEGKNLHNKLLVKTQLRDFAGGARTSAALTDRTKTPTSPVGGLLAFRAPPRTV